MAEKFYNDNPTLSDVVLFDLQTTDSSGADINPYKINQIVIYFIERGFTVDNIREYTTTFGDQTLTQYFKDAVPVEIFGNDEVPAWIGTDVDNAFVEQQDFDDEGNPLIGVFRLKWVPKLAKEGDYLLCYTWTPIVAGDTLSQTIQFYLYGNSRQTVTIPSHLTVPEKYETLLERYLPEAFKLYLDVQGVDLTPDVMDRLNQAIAKGFTTLEDLANHIVDLIDANTVADIMLSYLGNFFDIKLKSDDIALWRKQIKRAVPLYKKKGTLSGLVEALQNADIKLVSLTKLWQVVSKTTWQDGFIVTKEQENQSTSVEFTLSKTAILPIDQDNFELSIRLVGSSTYTSLTSDYVVLANGDGEVCTSGQTTMTWVGDQLSINPIVLEEGDVVRVVYKFAEPDDQSIEDYIRTLPLSDQRDETEVTYPLKNWNVRLIAEDDSMFDIVIPTRHPFQYPVVFGQIRTEFPYSENIYNMDSYNGSSRDSTYPCDLDKSFIDACGDCQSSKFNVDIEIEDLSAERLQEAQDIIKDFVPFHAVVHSINYSGSKSEYIPSPYEELEILVAWSYTDNIVSSQINFNRLIEEGSTDADELKRNMLASYTSSSYSGTGVNLAIELFSPNIRFDTLGIDSDGDNYLEILDGTDEGEYKVQTGEKYSVDIIQGVPDTINWPLDTSEFPYRISNTLYSDVSASVYQDDVSIFSDEDIEFIDYGTIAGWNIQITSGLYAGSYTITSVNTDNTLTISSFPVVTLQTGLSYNLRTPSNVVRYSGTGQVATTRRGRVEMDLVAQELGFRIGDYIKFNGTQYLIIRVEPRGVGATVDKIYISDYSGGSYIGSASVVVYRRLVDNATGYLAVRGMQLTGTVPTVSYIAENNQFLENYMIQIGLNYYQIASIDGSDMILNGPLLSWGLTGTSVSYSILHFTKTSPITSQAGDYQGEAHTFDRLDRRGQESYTIDTEIQTPMFMFPMMLNSINSDQPVDVINQQEEITISVEYR